MALGPFYVAQKLRNSRRHGVAIFMRHGETEWNREGRVMGRNPVALSTEGRAQVEAAAELARQIGPDLIVTSPLVRARETAEILTAALGGVQIADEPRLTEVEYGRWEGKTFGELISDQVYVNYRDHPMTMATPGGETLAIAQARGVAAVEEIMGANQSRRILFVSHGDIIRTIICHYMRLELAHFRRLRIDNAAFSAFEIGDNFAEIKFINLISDSARAFIAPFHA
jgi:alpha-ribazole phosphatase/probable phosphoglycerate mutase